MREIRPKQRAIAFVFRVCGRKERREKEGKKERKKEEKKKRIDPEDDFDRLVSLVLIGRRKELYESFVS